MSISICEMAAEPEFYALGTPFRKVERKLKSGDGLRGRWTYVKKICQCFVRFWKYRICYDIENVCRVYRRKNQPVPCEALGNIELAMDRE